MKSLKELSWQVDEPTYREDKALSYSTIAKYAREGFNKLSTLFDKVETPSLTFGSAVDAILTGGQEEFDKNFFVANFPAIKDSVEKVVKSLFTSYGTTCRTINDIKEADIITATEVNSFQLNWKPETRAKVIKEQGFEYYNLMFLAKDKKIISEELKQKIDGAVEALRTAEATKFYFQANSPFDGIERFYQLKFKATLNDADYRCMADIIVVDHNNKTVQPVDLKTSSHLEHDFYESWLQFRYDIQERLYWRIIRANMDKDEVYKDYKLLDYIFVVVNSGDDPQPLSWTSHITQEYGPYRLFTKSVSLVELRDPEDLGKELRYYLDNMPKHPEGINIKQPNNIINYLKIK